MTPCLSMMNVERTTLLRITPSTSLSCSTPYAVLVACSLSASSRTLMPCLSRNSPCLMQSSRETPNTAAPDLAVVFQFGKLDRFCGAAWRVVAHIEIQQERLAPEQGQ